MTGPWHPVAPVERDGRGHLRASDADREQVLDLLKTAFVYDLLTRDELAALTGRTLTSRTYADLHPITADTRLRPLQARPYFPPAAGAGARRPVSRKTVAWCTSMMILAPAMGAAFLTYYGGFFVLLFLAFIGATVTAQP